ncbi:hypothetical protein ACRZB4_002445 [Morganella morganii]|uniref:hypothetical protein n=1 Tax=Morganella morganii TaxID=582 RepID=UPI001C5B8455|nr:hypothetical protein [Morganella morganii]MBW4178831.1 hypothetical protein [Morganella morganii]HDU8624692.1 hypothetical protein [Morganella morganii]
MNKAMLKKSADDQLVFARQTLSMIANGEIKAEKSIKPIEAAISNISDAQVFLNGLGDQMSSHRIKLESIVMKIDNLTLAAIVLDDEGDSELQLDLLDKVREVINKELKPAIFS